MALFPAVLNDADAEADYLADLVGQLQDAEARNDVVAIGGLTDLIAFERAEWAKPGSGDVTDAMRRYLTGDD